MTHTTADTTITGLLRAVERGEPGAINALFPLVYEELNALAHQQRRVWHGDFTLNTTALVHEAYLKVADQKQLHASSRAHFFALAAKAMRHILCNYARHRGRKKRGGDVALVPLEPGHEFAGELHFTNEQAEALTALDAALRGLERVAERQARVVECRFFGGMSVDDTAAALGLSARTVKRDWTFARAWLLREMQLSLGNDD